MGWGFSDPARWSKESIEEGLLMLYGVALPIDDSSDASAKGKRDALPAVGCNASR